MLFPDSSRVICRFSMDSMYFFFFFQAEDGIRDVAVTEVQTCALPISDFNTRCIVAVVAPQHREVSPRIGIMALLDVLDPRAIYTDGDVVFFLAGHGAGVAPDATKIGRASCRERVEI